MRVWGILGMVAFSALVQAQGMMTTPGSFAVSESGAATYTIPIQVPPGTSGMEPKLALTYNSQAGNGLLGMGWSLSGLSAITRCPRTMAQDGVRGSINYDLNDRYCLDGQRLIAISGANGGNGAEYRTERESFAKIVSYGSAGNGPASFKVWTKDGLVMEYGATVDSAIQAQGKTSIAVWAVNKVADVKGNYYTVTYTKDSANDHYYPARIDYTGNTSTGLAPNNAVLFDYQNRTDIVSAYRGGSKSSIPVRLYRVRLLSGTSTVKRFDLSYVYSTATFRSNVSTISECPGSGTCMAPLNLHWNNAAGTGWQSTASYTPPAAIANNAARGTPDGGVRFIDLNGDGLVDMVQCVSYGILSATQKGAWLNTGDGWQSVPQYIPPPIVSAESPLADANDTGLRFVDLNGDGLPDVLLHIKGNSGGVSTGAWLNTGNGWKSASQYIPPVPIMNYAAEETPDTGVRFVDLNGDGLVDMVFHVKLKSGSINTGAWLNTGSGWQSAPQYIPPVPIMNNAAVGTPDAGVRFIDLNGDGLVDMVQYVQNRLGALTQTGAWLNTGNGWKSAPQYIPPVPIMNNAAGTPDTGVRFIDLNGDGLVDMVQYVQYGASTAGNIQKGAWLNTGNGWESAPQYVPPKPIVSTAADANGNDPGVRFVDLNGDGLPDMVQHILWNSGSINTGAWLNTGNGWRSAPQYAPVAMIAQNTSSAKDLGVRFIDLNGDGVDDMVQNVLRSGSNIQKGAWLNSQAGQPDQITKIDNGLGKQITITYKALPQMGSQYIKGPPSTYPKVDLQIPQLVVSSIAVSNGIGGTLTSTYKYGGLKAEQGTGRGLLGFAWQESTQAETGLTTRTEFRQDFPYTGLPSRVAVSKQGVGNGGLLKETVSTLGCLDPATGGVCTVATGKRYFPYASQSVEKSWDLNGAVLPVLTTTQQFDAWGNATRVTSSASDGYSKTTTNTYSNDTAKWHLGRLLRTQVQSTAP